MGKDIYSQLVDGGYPGPLAPSSPGGLVWGHSSRCFAFGGVSPCIILGQPGSDCIHTSATIGARVAPSTGISLRSLPLNLASLGSSLRTVHSPPELN
jgi:hypothetical protein